MIQRIVLAVAGIAIAALALWHPAPRPAFIDTAVSPVPAPDRPRHARPHPGNRSEESALVYVVGAVAKPGLYHLGRNARIADAVGAAGGLTAAADAAAIDLAGFVRDGDEVLVPASGGAPPRSTQSHRRARKRTATPTPVALDVNAADAAQLAAIPGIGRAIATRIVALREADGAFSSLDELLDVAGMTQVRLERARPYLQPP